MTVLLTLSKKVKGGNHVYFVHNLKNRDYSDTNFCDNKPPADSFGSNVMILRGGKRKKVSFLK